VSLQEGAPSRSPAEQDRDALIRQTELIISNVLRGGVLLSAGIILVGVVMFYAQYFASGQSGVSAYPHSFLAVFSGVAQGNPLSVIALGLLVLLITPVMRVAVSILAFGVERDWLYVVITTIVLIILLISFLLGKGGA
jgi:uncharacterized membrane protein